ncbi:MAG TPA: hypothetical protein PK360_18635 [bacterium]|nr:hypothetical protein [bacterium]
MSKTTYRIALAAAVIAMVATVSYAQAQQGQRRGFGGQTAGLLSDALVLNTEKSAKVTAAYDEARTQAMQGSQGDFQSMTPEQRRERFTKMQTDISAKMKELLKGQLSETELAAIEPVLSRRAMPDASLRALRQIDLKDEQRAKLQPLALKLVEAMVPGFPGGTQDAEREKALKKFEEEKAAFKTKAGEILTAEQKTAWETKTQEVQKEFDDMRARMRNRNQ